MSREGPPLKTAVVMAKTLPPQQKKKSKLILTPFCPTRLTINLRLRLRRIRVGVEAELVTQLKCRVDGSAVVREGLGDACYLPAPAAMSCAITDGLY